MSEWYELLTALLIGHAISDYPLQSDHMAKFKSWRTPSSPPPGQKKTVIWPYVLTAHALIHAGFVWLITGSWLLGMFELIAHWVIDLLKCSGITNLHQDQWMHIGCKVVWVYLLLQGVPQ